MDCDHVSRCLVDGVLDDAARAHASGCPACAELLADDAALGRVLAEGPSPALDPGLLARVTEVVATDRALGSRLSTPRRVAAWGLLAVAFVAAGAARPRGDLDTLGPIWMLALALTGASGAVFVGVALRPLLRPELPPSIRWAAGLAGLGLPFAVAAVPVADPTVGELLGGSTLACFAYGSLGVMLGVGGWWVLERRRKGGAWWLAIGAGAATGHAAQLVHCSVTDLGHTLAAHGTLALAWAAVGALLLTARAALSPALPPHGA